MPLQKITVRGDFELVPVEANVQVIRIEAPEPRRWHVLSCIRRWLDRVQQPMAATCHLVVSVRVGGVSLRADAAEDVVAGGTFAVAADTLRSARGELLARLTCSRN